MEHCNRRSSLQLGSALIALLAFGTSACTTVHRVPTPELEKLDGFREESKTVLETLDSLTRAPKYRLVDVENELHAFDSGTRLVLELQTGDARQIETCYQQISIQDGFFLGQPRERGTEVRVPLADVQSAGVREFSFAKTAGLVGAIAGTLLVGLVVLAATSDGSSSDSHVDLD